MGGSDHSGKPSGQATINNNMDLPRPGFVSRQVFLSALCIHPRPGYLYTRPSLGGISISAGEARTDWPGGLGHVRMGSRCAITFLQRSHPIWPGRSIRPTLPVCVSSVRR